jgi:hypothetical protein
MAIWQITISIIGGIEMFFIYSICKAASVPMRNDDA